MKGRSYIYASKLKKELREMHDCAAAWKDFARHQMNCGNCGSDGLPCYAGAQLKIKANSLDRTPDASEMKQT